MDPRCVYCKILPGWHTSIDEAEELPLELSKKNIIVGVSLNMLCFNELQKLDPTTDSIMKNNQSKGSIILN